MKRNDDNVEMVKKKLYVERQKTNNSYDRLRDLEDRKEGFRRLDPNKILSQKYDYRDDQKADKHIKELLASNIPLVDKEFSKQCPLVPTQLYAFFAAQKQGKTNFATNIAFSLYKDKLKLLFLTNEELKKDVLGRVASLDLGLNYNKYILGKYDDTLCERIEKKRQEVSEYVQVVSGEDADTLDADVICKIIEHAKNEGYKAIVLDYISKVSRRSIVEITNAWQAQEHLMLFLDEFKKNVTNPPVVVFSQIQKLDPKRHKPFKLRSEGRKILPNLATGVFEIFKLPNEKKTVVDIVNSRWYSGVDQWVFDFNNGRLTTSADNIWEAEDENDKI